ncbi:MAG: D-glucuronyl C5-epimerase family protein [Deferribacterales bacterium]
MNKLFFLLIISIFSSLNIEKNYILSLPLTQYYGDRIYLGNSSREKLDENGIIMTDYTAYGIGWSYNPEGVSRHALMNFSQYINDANEDTINKFMNYANWLHDNLVPNRDGIYSWWYNFNYHVNEVYYLNSPWASGMAQGQNLAVLARAYYITEDDKYLDDIIKALKIFYIDVSDGGVKQTISENSWWYEEYPTPKPTFVLNGFAVCLLGLYETNELLKSKGINIPEIEILLENGLNAFNDKINEFDIIDEKGVAWSSYNLSKKVPRLLLRFIRPRNATNALFIDDIIIKVNDKSTVLDVGTKQDTDKRSNFVYYNPAFQTWGSPELENSTSFRSAFKENGKFRHAPFSITFNDPNNISLEINYQMDADKAFLQLYDGRKYHTVSQFDITDKWASKMIELPNEIINKVYAQTSSYVNIERNYHDDHIILLYFIGAIQGNPAMYKELINKWLPACQFIDTNKINVVLKNFKYNNRPSFMNEIADFKKL